MKNIKKELTINYKRIRTFLENGGNPDTYVEKYVLKRVEGDFLFKETSGINSDQKYEYTQHIESLKPSYFYTVREFDEHGKFKGEVEKQFFGHLGFKYCKYFFYDRKKDVIMEKDFDNDFSNFNIKLLDLLDILSKTPIHIQKINKESK